MGGLPRGNLLGDLLLECCRVRESLCGVRMLTFEVQRHTTARQVLKPCEFIRPLCACRQGSVSRVIFPVKAAKTPSHIRVMYTTRTLRITHGTRTGVRAMTQLHVRTVVCDGFGRDPAEVEVSKRLGAAYHVSGHRANSNWTASTQRGGKSVRIARQSYRRGKRGMTMPCMCASAEGL